MAKDDKKNKGGRPKKQISVTSFEEACRIQCTRDEICALYGVSDKTLDRWCKDTYGAGFSVVYAEKRAGGKRSLRRAQWQAATIDRNPTLLIWMGKQHLGQRDPDRVQRQEAPQDDGVQIVNDLQGGGTP